MIHLDDEPPPDRVLEQLARWQSEVDVVASFPERVERARVLFKRRSRAGNDTFDAVRGALRAMCGDAEWCCYCERSQAAEIDHIRPRSLYPSHTFLWSNFLWVCGRCNKLKSDSFALIGNAEICPVPRRTPGLPPIPPPDGEQALIDPRREDPLDFFWLDLYSYRLEPAYSLRGLELARASYTIDTLDLNADALASQRARAYWTFQNELHAYVAACARGATPLERAGYRARVRRDPHKIVWESMKRRTTELDPHVAHWFAAAPEALDW